MLVKTSRLAVLLIVMLAMTTLGFAASERKISFSNNGNKVQLLNNTETGFELDFKLQDFSVEEVSTRAGVYDRLSIEGFGYSGRIGEPQLPVFSKLIAIPLGAQVQIEFFNRNQLTLNKSEAQLKNLLIPAQASVSKSENPELIPFVKKAELYSMNAFTGGELFKVEEVASCAEFEYFALTTNPSAIILLLANC